MQKTIRREGYTGEAEKSAERYGEGGCLERKPVIYAEEIYPVGNVYYAGLTIQRESADIII